MHAGLAALYDVRRREGREILEPEARRLDFAVPELPRLYHLIRLADAAGNRAHGIF